MIQNKTKITRKEVMGLITEPLSNIVYEKFYFEFVQKLYHDPSLSQQLFIDKLGKPNITMPDLESNPGVWILQDEVSGISFIIFSDLYKKNHFKGTFFEVVKDKYYRRAGFESVCEKLFNFVYSLARK
jgi:hypothetical protein